MRKQIAAANWKMNLTYEEAEKLATKLLQNGIELQEEQVVLLAVPFPYLQRLNQAVAGRKNIFVAAQNCAAFTNGAYTGEVSAAMLASMQIKYVLVGHSERREYFNENNKMLAEKIDRCHETGLQPVFCCGEPLQIREASTHNRYVATQLEESLFHLEAANIAGTIIAYEPIWAIGTGKTATSSQAQEMHKNIRRIMSEKYGDEVANSISILYGGSVKASNASEIFGEADVDGGLVGGASLNAGEFQQIIAGLKRT